MLRACFHVVVVVVVVVVVSVVVRAEAVDWPCLLCVADWLARWFDTLVDP